MITKIKEQDLSETHLFQEDTFDGNQDWLRMGVLMTMGSEASLQSSDPALETISVLCVPAPSQQASVPPPLTSPARSQQSKESQMEVINHI